MRMQAVSPTPDPVPSIPAEAGPIRETVPVQERPGISELHPATNARPLIRAGLIAILLVFGGLGTWAALAPLSGAVIGVGIVKVDLNRKTIQHLEGGIVKEIRVRDGDHVKAGDTLVVIADERVDATVDVLQGQLDAQMAKSARLAAERDGLEQVTFADALTGRADDPEVAQILRTESSFFDTRRRDLDDQIGLIKRQVGEVRDEITGLDMQLKAEETAAALLAQEIDANEQLERQHLVMRIHVLDLKQNMEAYNEKRGQHLSGIANSRQRISELELRIANTRDEYVQGAARELTDVNAQIFDLEERLRPSKDAQRRQQVVAPIGGTVVDVKVFTVGGVISPGEPIMDIVPDDNPLIVEAHISVDSINDIHLGSEADIRLTAFKRRSTPLVYGQVIYVSADRLINADTHEGYYLTRIRVTPQSLADAGGLALHPGMQAEVFIRTRERTALDYLLAPVTASMRRSFREP